MKPQEKTDAAWFAETAKQQLAALDKARSIQARAGLAALRERARHDLACMNFPAGNWVPERNAPQAFQDQRLLDVLVIGGGMCGQTVAFALMRDGVRNVRIVDAASQGAEGPWATFARMETLRSPKHLTGPDLGIPSLSYRAWYEAQHGEPGWDSLYKVPRIEWQDYLGWVRETVGIPVENDTRVLRIEPEGGFWRVTLKAGGESDDTSEETLVTRKIVLALGRGGSGLPRYPVYPSLDLNREAMTRPPGIYHSSDPIDFAALRGKRVAVLGAGSSAFDNAGTALESGAAEVHMFMRRDTMPQVNKSKWTAFPGFLRGYHALDDDRKWAIYTYIFNEQVPAPFESVLRCDKHPNFKVRGGEAWTDILPGPRVLSNKNQDAHPQGEAFDALIFATGFDVDLMENPLMTQLAPSIKIWADTIPASLIPGNEEASRFPYLGEAFEFQPKLPNSPLASGLANLHVFNWGCCMSHGAIAGDIPGLAVGANRLSQMIVRDIFVAEADVLQEKLYQHAELELAPTRFGLSPQAYAESVKPSPAKK